MHTRNVGKANNVGMSNLRASENMTTKAKRYKNKSAMRTRKGKSRYDKGRRKEGAMINTYTSRKERLSYKTVVTNHKGVLVAFLANTRWSRCSSIFWTQSCRSSGGAKLLQNALFKFKNVVGGQCSRGLANGTVQCSVRELYTRAPTPANRQPI